MVVLGQSLLAATSAQRPESGALVSVQLSGAFSPTFSRKFEVHFACDSGRFPAPRRSCGGVACWGWPPFFMGPLHVRVSWMGCRPFLSHHSSSILHSLDSERVGNHFWEHRISRATWTLLVLFTSDFCSSLKPGLLLPALSTNPDSVWARGL